MAETLVAARRAGRALEGFPGEIPADMTAAYEIQDAAMARWSDTLAGWKIGNIAPERRAPGARRTGSADRADLASRTAGRWER